MGWAIPRRLLLLFQRFQDPIWTQQTLCLQETDLSIILLSLGKDKNLLSSPPKASLTMRPFSPHLYEKPICVSKFYLTWISHIFLPLHPDSESRPMQRSGGRGWLRIARAVIATGQCSITRLCSPVPLLSHQTERACVSSQMLASLTYMRLSLLMHFPLENNQRKQPECCSAWGPAE